MVWTAVPSFVLALLAYLFIGLNIENTDNSDNLIQTMDAIKGTFVINPILLLPVLILLVMANKRFPPIPTIFAGAASAIMLALVFQTEIVLESSPNINNSALATIRGVWLTLFDGHTLQSGNTTLDDLMSGGGMSSMLNTVWLILCAMIFGSTMDHTGLLESLVKYALSFVDSNGSLISTTIFTCIGANIITSDQYVSIVLPGRMYKLEYENRKLDPKNLSRTLEDSATITSPLVPWNTCGAYMSGTLGIATFAYLPWCFFNLICPAIALLYGFLNFKIISLAED
jgi:NhaC family Na+:H+ antiporter